MALVTQGVNGSFSNTSTDTWQLITQGINGSFTNISTDTWQLITQGVNGSFTNTSTDTWQLITQGVNGTFTNVSDDTWTLVTQGVNGTFINTTIDTWQLITQGINGSFTNTSLDTWQITEQGINGTFTGTITLMSISNVAPTNSSYINHIYPTLYFTINHSKAETMNYTIFWGNSSTNTTITVATGENINNGTYYTALSNASEYITTYHWRVQYNDGTNWVNETFSFTTRHESPTRIVHENKVAMGIMGGLLLFAIYIFIRRNRRKKYA